MVAQPAYWLHWEITSWPAVGFDFGHPTITEPIDYEGFCAAPAHLATEAVGVLA